MANKTAWQDIVEIYQYWCFRVKYRERRGWWFDFLAKILRRLEK